MTAKRTACSRLLAYQSSLLAYQLRDIMCAMKSHHATVTAQHTVTHRNSHNAPYSHVLEQSHNATVTM